MGYNGKNVKIAIIYGRDSNDKITEVELSKYRKLLEIIGVSECTNPTYSNDKPQKLEIWTNASKTEFYTKLDKFSEEIKKELDVKVKSLK